MLKPDPMTASVDEKLEQLRTLFADAPEVGKKALENVLGQAGDAGHHDATATDRRAPVASAAGWGRSRS